MATRHVAREVGGRREHFTADLTRELRGGLLHLRFVAHDLGEAVLVNGNRLALELELLLQHRNLVLQLLLRLRRLVRLGLLRLEFLLQVEPRLVDHLLRVPAPAKKLPR